MKIDIERHDKYIQTLGAMRQARQSWWTHWREVADYYLPHRYVWLLSDSERRARSARSQFILNSTGTLAARTLAAGMMNGITSPARPWFKLRLAGYGDDLPYEARVWLDEVEKRMMLVMAESNFYNALAVLYLDLVVFGTASMLIYEDFDSVIRCYNPALGEFYLAQDSRLSVNTFAREFQYTVRQLVERFGEENCSSQVRDAWRRGGATLQNTHTVCHLIEPNDQGHMSDQFAFCEYYWEQGAPKGEILEKKGFFEKPGIFARWELTGNDAYGTCPAMDALGDVIQLQHETKKKAQGLDKMVSPPLIADVQLQHRPMALLPNGVTFVQGVNNIGVKPAYTVAVPIGELTLDIREIEARVREAFHNDLFRMISQLETVRSATEIDARREEKLVLLGPVLDRFESEGLDPAIRRIYATMARFKLLPPPPQSISDAPIEIQYVSILSSAQRAVGVVPLERWLGLVGNITPVEPRVRHVPDWIETVRLYATEIGVPQRALKDRRAIEESIRAEEQTLAAQQAAQVGPVLVDSAKALSETQVGGGQNALERMLQ